jgi:hypothetical protein
MIGKWKGRLMRMMLKSGCQREDSRSQQGLPMDVRRPFMVGIEQDMIVMV